MRENVRAFVAAAREFNIGGPIYEFGSYLVAGQEQLANLRPLFPGREYVGCDMRPGAGVDRVEDLSSLRLANESVATILCMDTLEHVFEVRKAVNEMLRVLRPGGMLVVSVPLDFRIHDHPDDYWRLTPSCLSRLLSPLSASVVGSQGLESYPHTVLALGFKSPAPTDFPQRAQRLLKTFEAWCEARQKSEPLLHKCKRYLAGAFRSKGERRRIQAEYQSRFAVHFGASTWQDARAAIQGLTVRS